MFIFLDESFGKTYTVIGCLCIPLDQLPTQEASYVTNRIKTNCWGELDWSGISKEYLKKYESFLHSYLSDEKVTFHSWAYKNPDGSFKGNPEKVLFTHEYSLLKNTIRKCTNAGYRKFHILLDDGQDNSEYKLTREYLEKTLSIRPKPEIAFYSAIDSKIIGAMQITSLCVSAVRYLYGTESVDAKKELCNEIISLLTDLNLGTPINFSPKSPKWDLSKKITHCLFDPILKKPEFKTIEDSKIPF